MTRDQLTEVIKTNPGMLVAVLDAIYQFQTFDEQMMQGTLYQNGQGFNHVDADICTSMLNYYRRTGTLSERQVDSLRRCLPKYLGQLEGRDIQPLPFKQYGKPAEAPVDAFTVITNNKIVKHEGDDLLISFPYDALMVSQVKTLTNRRWNSLTKQWIAPICKETVEKLMEWGFDLPSTVRDWHLDLMQSKAQAQVSSSGLKASLFPYQLEGVQFIENRKGRALIADSMGLGKTCQALSWLQLHPEHRPAVIVVPASLKLNWVKEIKFWMMENCSSYIISGKATNEVLPKSDIYIINYDILAVKNTKKDGKRDKFICRQDVLDLKPSIVIADEVHLVKSRDAQRSKAFLDLAKKCKHVIALSGTPIVNRPMEIYNAISAVEPKLFPSFFKFAHKYCGAKHNGFGWDFNGSSNTEELHRILTETIMIRRTKDEVLKELPPKMRNVIPIELENEKRYRKAELDFIEWLRNEFGNVKADKAMQAEALVRIGGLKQLAVEGKINACVEWIQDFLESGEKLVVFAVHKHVIDRLMFEFKDQAVKVDGSISSNNGDRQKAVDEFQNNPNIKLFVGNIKAAGVGLTLTAASNTCFLELGWTPGDHDQAEDRVHRIGQTAESVNAWYLLSQNTIESEIAELIDKKRKILSQVLDGQDVDENSMFSELLSKYIG